MKRLCLTVLLLGALCAENMADEPHRGIRVATYNVAMYRTRAGELAEGLRGGEDSQARRLAAVIQRVRPDVLLLCEIDYDPENDPPKIFAEEYLAVGRNGLQPVLYPFRFTAPVNTGVPTGIDLDQDGRDGGPNDCYGYGRYPGQYGMAVLSRLPIDEQATRTFQKLLWRDVPGHRKPVDPRTDEPYYADEAWDLLRLPSKSFWDVVIRLEQGRPLHLICSHPTPPVFDGPEDKNGLRNADEVRLVRDYITYGAGGYFVDDSGKRGQLPEEEPFVVLGDLNADPNDGNGVQESILELLDAERLAPDPKPKGPGGAEASRAAHALNESHVGDPAMDTGDFGADGHANLRIDYALPSKELTVLGQGVHWPASGSPGADEVGASDHRLVWVDVSLDE